MSRVAGFAKQNEVLRFVVPGNFVDVMDRPAALPQSAQFLVHWHGRQTGPALALVPLDNQRAHSIE